MHAHTQRHTHMHGRRKNSAWPLLKVGHKGGTKICRNGNESTFWQTSMHHAGTSNNKKNFRTSKYPCTAHARQALPYNKHTYTPPPKTCICICMIPPNYSPSRFDAETRPRSVRCGRGGDYVEAHPHQLYINKYRFNTQNGGKYEQNGLGERRGTSCLEVGEGMKWVGVGGRCHLF